MQPCRVIPLLLFLVLTLSFPPPSTSSIPPTSPSPTTPTSPPPPPCLVPFRLREGFFNGFIRSIHDCSKYSCAGFSYGSYKLNFENCEKEMVMKNLSMCETVFPSPTPYNNYKKYQELFDFSDEDCGILPSSEPDYDIFVHFRQGDFAHEKQKRVNTPTVEELIELITHIQNVSNLTTVYIETDGPIEWAVVNKIMLFLMYKRGWESIEIVQDNRCIVKNQKVVCVWQKNFFVF